MGSDKKIRAFFLFVTQTPIVHDILVKAIREEIRFYNEEKYSLIGKTLFRVIGSNPVIFSFALAGSSVVFYDAFFSALLMKLKN